MHVNVAGPRHVSDVIPFLFHLSSWELPRFSVHEPDVSVEDDHSVISNR